MTDFKPGDKVHLRKHSPQGGWSDEVAVWNGRPVLYEVISVEPAHDVEVTGGTAHVGLKVTVKDGAVTFTVPSIRLVPATE